MINQQDIDNITSSFVPEYANFVKGSFAATASDQFAKVHNFTSEQKEALQDGITLYFLTVFTTNDLLEHLISECSLSRENAQLLMHALHAGLPKNFTLLHEATRVTLSYTPEPVAPRENISTENTSTETPPKQVSTPSIGGIRSIRTMAGDMAKTQTSGETIYSSTQEAILKERK